MGHENGFAIFFVFVKIINREVQKMHISVVNDYAHANFSLDMDVFIFLNYCYWVCLPSKFSKSVLVVFDNAYTVSALPTPFRIVIDYTDTMFM